MKDVILHETDRPQIDMVSERKLLIGSFYVSASPHETFGKLPDFYLKGKIDIESLATRRYDFEQANDGLAAFETDEDSQGIIAIDSSRGAAVKDTACQGRDR